MQGDFLLDEEQERLTALFDDESDSDEALQALFFYTTIVYALSERDGEGGSLEVTVDGVVRKSAKGE